MEAAGPAGAAAAGPPPTGHGQLRRVERHEYHRGFLQSVFTGEASDAPKTLATSAGVLRFVFNVPGAIGYVRASERDSSVKTLVFVELFRPNANYHPVAFHRLPRDPVPLGSASTA